MHRGHPLRPGRPDGPGAILVRPVTFAVASRTARDASVRGGDLFEALVRSDGSSTILMGDTSSKGALATAHVAIVRAAFLKTAAKTRDPARILSELNATGPDVPATALGVPFASAFVATIEPGLSLLRYASAGHDLAFIARGHTTMQLAPSGPILGIFLGAEYGERFERFTDEDLLLLMTDGFSECRSASERTVQFGTDGIIHTIESGAPWSPRSATAAIVRNADAFTGGFYRDDATVAVVQSRRALSRTA